MKNKTILAIIMVAIMLAGCGKVNEEITAKAPEKKEETIVETEVGSIAEEVSGKEDERTTEVVEENTEETVPVEQTHTEEVQKTETKKTQSKTETPVVTTPVVSETVVATPEVKECEHLYEPVETEEYERIEPHYIFGCNGCGFPLFTIDPDTHDAVNIPDLYFHRECYSEKLGMMCPKPCGWHSEVYYQGYCYTCHDEIQLRACTYFYVRAETCVQNTGDLGGYEKVEPGYAYIKSCDCGANTIMVGQNGKNLLLKKEQCVYCGHTKSYPEK
jgi:hypothetical protein